MSGRRHPMRLPPPTLYYGWILVITLGVTTIISYGTTYFLFGVLVVPVSHQFGWSRTSLSGIYALGTILAGLLGVPIGRLVDRHGGRRLMVLGSLTGGAMLLGLSVVTEEWQFYLLWGGGYALVSSLTFYPVSFTIVTNWFERRRGAAFALLTLVGGLASPIFIPLAGALIARFGWRVTLVILALVQLGIALPLHALIVRRHPEDLGLRPDGADVASRSPSTPMTGMSLRAAMQYPAFWTLAIAYSLVTLSVTVLLVHSVPYLIGRGYNSVLAASVVGASGLASLLGRILVNLLSDRLGAQRLLALCLGAQAGGVVLLLHGDSLGWLMAYVVVYGVSLGGRVPLGAAVMADHFGRRAYGGITAIQGIPIALAGGLGLLGAGWLYDQLRSYNVAFGLCAAAFIVAAIVVVFTPRSRLKTNPTLCEDL